MPIQIQFGHHIVGHAAFDFGAGHVPAIGVFLARIAYHHVVVERLPHLRQILRQLSGTDNQQAPARAMHGDKLFAVKFELIGIYRRLNRRESGFHIQRAFHQFVALNMREQLVDAARGGKRLQHQLQRAAARQTKTRGFFGGHAVLRGRRFVLHQLAIAHAQNHVVFDAAAGNRADHHAVITNSRQRADRARRGAPGFHHRGHHHTAAFFNPGARGFENLQVYAIHENSFKNKYLYLIDSTHYTEHRAHAHDLPMTLFHFS